MINDNTILSSFDDRPTLLEWLKKVEDALKTDTATAVSVENPSANTYVFKITFADGTTLSSGNVVFPDSVKDVSIKNGHIIVTQISGTQTDLGVLNPYADTIVENAETNTTEIGNNVEVGGDLSVQGSVVGRGIVTSIGRLTANGGIEVHGQGYVNGTLGVTGNATIGGRLQTDSSIISNGEIRGGNISGTKFLLGTEEMPLVKANPTDEATATLEKVKIGDVAYNVGGGGGGTTESVVITNPSTNRALTLSAGYDSRSFFCDTLSIRTNGEKDLGINLIGSPSCYTKIRFDGIGYDRYLVVKGNNITNSYLYISASRAAIPDVPKSDGTYILKASVSGDSLTYSWELQQ